MYVCMCMYVFIYPCVCISNHVCMHVCVCIPIYAPRCMYVNECIYRGEKSICMCMYVYVCMHGCAYIVICASPTYECMHICIYSHTQTYTYTTLQTFSACSRIYIYIYIYTYIYIPIRVYAYIYIYTHTHTHTQILFDFKACRFNEWFHTFTEFHVSHIYRFKQLTHNKCVKHNIYRIFCTYLHSYTYIRARAHTHICTLIPYCDNINTTYLPAYISTIYLVFSHSPMLVHVQIQINMHMHVNTCLPVQ
jgi:hypothetical protein